MERLLKGLNKFQFQVFPERREYYERVATSQKPDVLFVTCGDSRIDPELLTQSGPGEIFVERNPENLIPVYCHFQNYLGMCLTQVGTVSQHFVGLTHWAFVPRSR